MPSPDSYSPLGRWSSISFSSQMMSWDENQPMIIHDLSLVVTEITSPWQQLLNYLVNPQILNQSSMMADSHGTILNSLDCHLQYCNHNKKLQHTTTDPIHTHKKNKGNQQKTNTEKNIRNSLRFQISQHIPTKAEFWSWSDQSPIKTVSYLNPPTRSRDSLGFRAWMPLATPSGLQQSARGDWNRPSLCCGTMVKNKHHSTDNKLMKAGSTPPRGKHLGTFEWPMLRPFFLKPDRP